jgi:hypothetical protein
VDETATPLLKRPARSRWTSFVAGPHDERAADPGRGDRRTMLAVDRATRRWAVAEADRQVDAAEAAYEQLYSG